MNAGAYMQVDQLFQESRLEYHRAFNVACQISSTQHGIDTDGRGVMASSIFTRQCVIAATLDRILPENLEHSQPESQLWDICSIGSISRNILEGFQSLYYFGTEIVSESDADLRFQLQQLHRNIEHHAFTSAMRPDGDHSALTDTIEIQKERVRNHPYLDELTPAQRNKARQVSEMYMTRGDFERLIPACRWLSREFRILSNVIHPSPLYLGRTDNVNGRGIGSMGDIAYCGVCVTIATNYLSASVVNFTDHFTDHISVDCRRLVDTIRPIMPTE